MSTVVGLLSDEFVYLRKGARQTAAQQAVEWLGQWPTRLTGDKSMMSTSSTSPCFGKKSSDDEEELPAAVEDLRRKVATLQKEHGCAMDSLASLTTQVAKKSVLAMQRFEQRLLCRQEQQEHKMAAQCALLAEQARVAVEEVRTRVLEVASTVAASGNLDAAGLHAASEVCDGHALQFGIEAGDECTSSTRSVRPLSGHCASGTALGVSYEESLRCFTNGGSLEEVPDTLRGAAAAVQDAFALLETSDSSDPLSWLRHNQHLQPEQEEVPLPFTDSEELSIGAHRPKEQQQQQQQVDELERLLQLTEVSWDEVGVEMSSSGTDPVNYASMGLSLSRSASKDTHLDSQGPGSQCLSRWHSGMIVAETAPLEPQDSLDGSVQTLQPANDSPAHVQSGPAAVAAAGSRQQRPVPQLPAPVLGRSQSTGARLLHKANSPTASWAPPSSTIQPQHGSPVRAVAGTYSICRDKVQQLRLMHSSSAVFTKGQQLTPRSQQLMPQSQQPMPQQLTPQGQQHVLQGQQSTPCGQRITPCRRPSPPQGTKFMPQSQQLMPQGQQLAPPPDRQCAVLQGQQLLPQDQQMSPRGQLLSPQRHQISPRGPSPSCGAQARAVLQARAAVPASTYERAAPAHSPTRDGACTPSPSRRSFQL